MKTVSTSAKAGLPTPHMQQAKDPERLTACTFDAILLPACILDQNYFGSAESFGEANPLEP